MITIKANKNLYSVTPIGLGMEYVYGEPKAFKAAPNGSRTGEDNCVSAVAIYNFKAFS